MRALALLALAACGGRGSPTAAQPSAADRIEILAGELSLVPPIAAKLEPNRADSIMAAPPSPVSQAVVRMKDGGHHVTAIFRRTWEACAPDPATTIRQYTNAWRTTDGDVTLTSLTTSGGLAATIYLPTKPRRRGDITSLGSILVCAGASGLVSANVMVEGDDLAAARRFTTALASSLAAGSRPTVTSARQVQVEGCSETFSIDAPESFAAYEEVGADFSVFRFQKISSAEDDPSFAHAIRSGDGDHHRAPERAGGSPLGGRQGRAPRAGRRQGRLHRARVRRRSTGRRAGVARADRVPPPLVRRRSSPSSAMVRRDPMDPHDRGARRPCRRAGRMRRDRHRHRG